MRFSSRREGGKDARRFDARHNATSNTAYGYEKEGRVIVIDFVKRYLGESMVAAGLCFLVAAFCWSELLNQDMLEWKIYRENIWFRQNWPVLILAFGFCALGSPLLLVCGATVCIVRDRRQAGREVEAKLPGRGLRGPDDDESLAL